MAGRARQKRRDGRRPDLSQHFIKRATTARGLVALASIREKLRYSNIPAPLRGLGIAFIMTGLMGLAFMSFAGISLS